MLSVMKVCYWFCSTAFPPSFFSSSCPCSDIECLSWWRHWLDTTRNHLTFSFATKYL